MSKYCFRQIRIDKNIYLNIKSYCVINEKKLFNFYQEVLDWFFENTNNNSAPIYQASHKKGQLLSMRLTEDTAKKINKFANEANVSNARIIHTAISRYIEHLKI